MWIDEWAARWCIPPEAMREFRFCLGVSYGDGQLSGASGSESRQQSLVRIDAAQQGVWLTRNNVGALLDERGVPVRYGLANESKAQNTQVKSADLIGIRSVLIEPQHVGRVIGQFVSREVKHEAWKWVGDKHEQAQLNWCNFVLSKGGDASFSTGRF
jgi:hypothetical protein